MDIEKAVQVKLNNASLKAEQAWRQDLDAFYESVDFKRKYSVSEQIKNISSAGQNLIRLKAALLMQVIEEFRISGIEPKVLCAQKAYIISQLDSEKYSSRLDNFIKSIERKFGRYGLKFDASDFRTDIEGSLYLAGVNNIARRTIANVEADFAIIASTTGGSSKLETLNEVIELKPNIAGFGINLNALIKRFANARST